jgi:hypothetical protein
MLRISTLPHEMRFLVLDVLIEIARLDAGIVRCHGITASTDKGVALICICSLSNRLASAHLISTFASTRPFRSLL